MFVISDERAEKRHVHARPEVIQEIQSSSTIDADQLEFETTVDDIVLATLWS